MSPTIATFVQCKMQKEKWVIENICKVKVNRTLGKTFLHTHSLLIYLFKFQITVEICFKLYSDSRTFYNVL